MLLMKGSSSFHGTGRFLFLRIHSPGKYTSRWECLTLRSIPSGLTMSLWAAFKHHCSTLAANYSQSTLRSWRQRNSRSFSTNTPRWWQAKEEKKLLKRKPRNWRDRCLPILSIKELSKPFTCISIRSPSSWHFYCQSLQGVLSVSGTSLYAW